jgi:hypothetical protein
VTLYDFLYIDHHRLKSLYSQLFSGLLSAIERVASESRAETTSAKVGPSFLSGTTSSRQTETESRLDRIDPHDLILQDVLQALAEKNFIQTNVSQAQPGNIILLNGSISILNFEAYRHILAMLPHLMPSSPPPQTSTQKKNLKHQEREEKKQRETISNILKGLSDMVPWGLQIIMKTESATAWGALLTENLRELPGNISLKVGPTLSGKWYLLGIIDIVGPSIQDLPDNMTMQIKGIMDASEAFRSMIGRPDDYIGITPLLIFRKLA